MHVYGDHGRQVNAGRALAEILERAESLRGQSPGIAWHGCCVALLIELGQLLQGIADRDLEERGNDDDTFLQRALIKVLLAVARSVRLSWRSDFAVQELPDTGPLQLLALEGSIRMQKPEGYAFYAVYPEAYLTAARSLSPGAVIIGLRSIGTSLASIVGEASRACKVLTVRPRGHPFCRTIAAGPRLAGWVQSHANREFVVVDEGPGLSGSSFGGTADWLESLGVARDRIVFMPSHGGSPGRKASEHHHQRWFETRRPIAQFESVLLSGKDARPLADWFADITGKVGSIVDVSGGAWAGPAIPTDPGREARKYRLSGESGCFRLKFIGLGRAGEDKLDRAEALHQAGFGVRPLALRHGFLMEEHCGGEPAPTVPLRRLAAYLSFRADRFSAAAAGATLAALIDMAHSNLMEAGLARAGSFARRAAEGAEKLQALCRPMYVDGRLHAWEWLEVGDVAVKTDALDHAEAHDLVGCQDIAWDIAGARVEFGLDGAGARWLCEQVRPPGPGVADLLETMTYCYLGFQLGWWSLSSSRAGQERSLWYARRAEAFLERASAGYTS